MSLRKTTLLAIVLTTVGLIAVLLFSQRMVLLPYFEQEQTQTVQLNLQRALSALDAEFSYLTQISRDWAKWDDTYTYVQDRNTTYWRANLQLTTFRDLQLNLFALLDDEGQVVFAINYDLVTEKAEPLPEALTHQIQPGSQLLAAPDDLTGRQGFLDIDGRALLIVSHPVLPTDGVGPALGTLLIGRYLDADNLERISNSVQLPLTLYPANKAAPESARSALLKGDSYYMEALDDTSVAGYTLLKDINDQPAFLLRADQPQSVYRTGILLVNYLVVAQVMSGITFSAILFLLLEMTVLGRLRRLSRDVTAIGASGDITRRVAVTRHDELTRLGQSINATLDSLAQAQKQRQESEGRFRTLVESMDDVVFTVSNDLSAVETFGQKANAIGMKDILSSASASPSSAARLGHLQALQKALSGEQVSFEWSFPGSDQPRHFLTALSPIRSADGAITGAVGVGREITERKQLEERLRHQVADLDALHMASQVLLGQLEPAETLAAICRLAVEQFGLQAAWIALPRAEQQMLIPLHARGFQMEQLSVLHLHLNAADLVHPAVTACRTGQPQVVAPLYSGESDAQTAAGAALRALACLPLPQNDQPGGVLAVYSAQENFFSPEKMQLLQAFTNLASATLQNASLFEQVSRGRERLQDLSRRLVDIQEGERRRIALELHDQIGQILTGLKLLLDSSAALPAVQLKPRLEQAQELANDLISRVRQMSLNLRPSLLDDLGLVPALLWLFERYTAQTNVGVVFRHTAVEGIRFPIQIETAAYRLVQEALTNVARHAGVNEVIVRLWRADDRLGVQVEDAGCGFNPADILNGESSGLLGQRERLGLLGGRLTIDANPGSGACLTAELPLNGQPLEEEE